VVSQPWAGDDVVAEIRRRAGIARAAREVRAEYYRIGFPLAFALPVDHRPTDFPRDIPGVPDYPWLIWLAWALEERWHSLHAAWRLLGDGESGALVQSELAALARWESFDSDGDTAGLMTATFAGCLTAALADPAGWDAARLESARSAAGRLIEDTVWPWFVQSAFAEPPAAGLTPEQLHNIPVITVSRGAQLATTLGHPRAEALNAAATYVYREWLRLRAGGHTEGSGYDGYLLDHATAWIDTSAERAALAAEGREPLSETMRAWAALALPGRPDLLAPLADTEGEMPFWVGAAFRVARWTDDGPLLAWLRRFPLERLPAAQLLDAHAAATTQDAPYRPPRVATHPGTVTLRGDELLAAVSAPAVDMGHLHRDAGHFVFGWRGRFWITDAGYQQYRSGEEREYTLGPDAQNSPVIGGRAQTRRRARVLAAAEDHVALDLTDCYEGLPDAAAVRRELWLRSDGVVVRDEVSGLDPQTAITTNWLGGTALAWGFVDGWTRLSNGAAAVWLGTADESGPGALSAAQLRRHPGSRGPLTLSFDDVVDGAGVRWWRVHIDPECGWRPPAAVMTEDVNG
jgi:hypothetical protein